MTYVQKTCSVGETPDKRDSAPPVLFYLMPIHYCAVCGRGSKYICTLKKKKSFFFLLSFCGHKRNSLPIKGSSDKSLYSLNFGVSPLP